jgi:bifunctional DNA-binding transcriptional regulator/antitoxin component of YhaV-PrlF toxin-antitoxin module
MGAIENTPVKQPGNVVLPKGVRSAGDLKQGDLVLLELTAGGRLVLRLAEVEPATEPEEYTPERKAEFLLSNAVSDADYLAAREEVRQLGLEPDQVPHYRHGR